MCSYKWVVGSLQAGRSTRYPAIIETPALYEKQRAEHIMLLLLLTLYWSPCPLFVFVHFITGLKFYYVFYFIVASSCLNTTPSPTIQSAANNAIPENVPPTTRTTAASSTEKPIIIHSTTGKYNYTNLSIKLLRCHSFPGIFQKMSFLRHFRMLLLLLFQIYCQLSTRPL